MNIRTTYIHNFQNFWKLCKLCNLTENWNKCNSDHVGMAKPNSSRYLFQKNNETIYNIFFRNITFPQQ